MRTKKILLVQLPIPPAGVMPIVGNVPLAAAYLKMVADARGLGENFAIEILPAPLANLLSDVGLVEEICRRAPDVLGFSCYLWNIDRSLWIAERVRARIPGLRVIVGGPEITADNASVLQHPAVDFAVIGEGEQTFSALLSAWKSGNEWPLDIPGLWVRERSSGPPKFRSPLPKLDEISSPYLTGILDAADEKMLMLETIRGCTFKCKFCYYPKSYDGLYFLSEEKAVANLRHARERGATDVVLLDPTLNQRKDFAGFLKLLARENPGQQFRYFGELRSEGITPEIATLLRAANFTEVEIGLQSVDGTAQKLMDRKNNMKAFERGIAALLDAGIEVKVDLIIGLPGDTPDSVRSGVQYLKNSGLYSTVQVFQLAILPGTAFRHEAAELELSFQKLPPYYVLNTPNMSLATMIGLMDEAQDAFGVEFDPHPEPALEFSPTAEPVPVWLANLDEPARDLPMPAAHARAQAFTVWFRAADFSRHLTRACEIVEHVLADNPATTLQIVLEPTGEPSGLSPAILDALLAAAQHSPSYLDRFYSLQPGRVLGAKRIVLLLDAAHRATLGPDWAADLGDLATIVWRGLHADPDELEIFEYALA